MTYAIEARDLYYTYEDGTVALDHISFRAERGKITGILGANGAGKSTLFLNLNGVLTPAGGEVRVDGIPVTYDRKGLISVPSRWVSSFRTRMTSFFPPTYIVTSHLEA